MSDSGEHSCMLLGEVTSAGTADESSSKYHISISAASETAGSSSSPFAANAPAANVKRKRTKSKPLHFTPELEEDIAEWWRANTILYDKSHHRFSHRNEKLEIKRCKINELRKDDRFKHLDVVQNLTGE